MRFGVFLILACAIGLTGFARTSFADPATEQVDALKREIADLKRENQRLTDELAGQRHETAVAKAAATQPAAVVKKDWKEELKVGMTEAQANDLFATLPRQHGALPTQKTVSTTDAGKVVEWLRDPIDQAAGSVGSHANLTQAPRTRPIRLCTITFKGGVVAAVEY